MASDYLPGSPFRPVDWRWLRTIELFEGSGRPGIWDDADIPTLLQYRRALARADTARQAAALQQRFPVLDAAHILYLNGGPRRLWLEAWLLTAQSPEVISVATDTPVGVVTVFERVFFNVLREGRLNGIGWIVSHVLTEDRDYRSPSDGTVAKYMALAGGSVALTVLMEEFRPHDRSDEPAQSPVIAKARWLTRAWLTPNSDTAAWRQLLKEARSLFPVSKISTRAERDSLSHLRTLRMACTGLKKRAASRASRRSARDASTRESDTRHPQAPQVTPTAAPAQNPQRKATVPSGPVELRKADSVRAPTVNIATGGSIPATSQLAGGATNSWSLSGKDIFAASARANRDEPTVRAR